MSHNSSPRRGASDDSVTARISRLVIWPSCSNRLSARPDVRARTRASGAAVTSIATTLSASVVPRSNPAAVVARMRSRGPPSASSTVRREAPKPVSVRSFASAAGPSPSEVSARISRAGLQMRADQIERAAVQRQQHRLRQRPAEPRRGQRKGRRRRHDDHLARIDVPRQHRADAVVERIAGREHADLPAAMAQDFFGRAVERARPWPRSAANERRRQRRDAAGRRTRSPLPRSGRAPPGSAPRRHPRRCRRWTASAAMRQCRAEAAQDFACHASSFSAAPRKRACSANGSPSAAIST